MTAPALPEEFPTAADLDPYRDAQYAGLAYLGWIAGEQADGTVTAPQAAVMAPQPAVITAAPAAAGKSRMTLPGRLHVPTWWPLPTVLAIQAALSLRLIWSNTAFQDEALYLWAGHLEWAHWLHGTPISAAAFPSYFSGAPVVYPPLGALADMVGGLAAARLLSLAFILGATSLLYGTTRRLFDRTSAIFASVLFAGTGSAQFLGAFATYDAMALFLLSAATWTAVRAAATPRLLPAAALYVLGGAEVALADVAKYAAALFDPVVIGVALLAAWRLRGARTAIVSVTLMLGISASLIGVALRLGGSAYWRGLETTTLSRAPQNVPAPGVLFISSKWIGAVAFLAVCGALAAWWSPSRPTRLLGCLLALAVFLAPVEQARIHEFTSLFKHVGYGGWFGCVVAGYALASLLRAVAPTKAHAAVRVATGAAILASVSGIAYADAHFAVWPGTSGYVAALRAVLASARGPVLIDDASVPEYYLHVYTGFEQITNSSYFAYTDPSTRKRLTQPPAAYKDAVHHRYFAVISLVYGSAPTVYDPGIISDIRTSGGYRLVSSIPYRTPSDSGRFLTWERAGR